MHMKRNGKKYLVIGIMLLALFFIWTVLIQRVDVKPLGQNGTTIGVATLNVWFHKLLGVHMTLYTITDWLGLVPVAVCMVFAGIGFIQLVKRRSLLKVDADILLLGIYYVLVIGAYLLFEMVPINYRPVLIEGRLEASYPSSTTLLVLCVMPTLVFQAKRRVKKPAIRNLLEIFATAFSVFMVLGRAVYGVHWLTDIIGAVLLSAGLVWLYKAAVLLCCKKKTCRRRCDGIS